MRLKLKANQGMRIAATCLLVCGYANFSTYGEEPPGGSRLARLFRLGGGGSSPNPSSSTSSQAASHNHNLDKAHTTSLSTNAATPTLVTTPTSPTQPPSTPDLGSSGSAHRITPHSRISRPPTESDPVLTRVALGRADNGTQFGMFLQVYADGTVIDGEGVHHVGAELMRPLLETLQKGDLYRMKGHCGAPSTDEIEAAQVVVYERAYGKLRATSFSYSGNPQGCDPSVNKMHKALEAIQMKLSQVAPSVAAVPGHNAAVPAQAIIPMEAAASTPPPLIRAASFALPLSTPRAPVANPAPAAVLTLTPPNP